MTTGARHRGRGIQSPENMDQNNLSYVTLRKKVPRPKSLESLRSNSLSSTSSDDILGKSLDLSTNIVYSTCIEEMKSEIRQLKSNLESTQNELENIILENVNLNKQISQLNKDLGVLKHICRSPVTSLRKNNMSPNSKKALRRRLTDSFQTTPLHTKDSTIDPVEPREKQVEQPETLPKQDYGIQTNIKADNASPKLPPKCKNFCKERNIGFKETTARKTILRFSDEGMNEPSKNRRVLVFGGQQCSGLALKLIKSRSHYIPSDQYQFQSFIKPYASTEEILTCSTSCNDMTSADRVIIAIGQHDTNPLKIIAELCIFLKSVKCPVLILSVRNNIYLNEIKLNDMLDLLCRQYRDCEFVDLHSEQYNTYNVCKRINFVLDQLDYRKGTISSRVGSKCGQHDRGLRTSRVSGVNQSTQTDNSHSNLVVSDEDTNISQQTFFRDL